LSVRDMSLQVEQPASAAVIATAASSLALVLVLVRVLVLAPCAAFPCRLVQCIAVCSS
jgi:hypothetical protein